MFLIVVKGANIGTVFPLNKLGPIIMGRGKECDIRFLDLMVSRKHCQIERKSDGFYIRDLGSTNKTVLSRKIIGEEEKLKADDIIEIGKTVLLFTDQEEISIKDVEHYTRMIDTRTVRIDLPPEQ